MKKEEKREKKAKKDGGHIAGKRPAEMHPRLEEVVHAIRSNLAARRTMKDLVAAGCDETALLTNLFYYCGGTEEEVRAGLKEAREFIGQVDRVSGQLLEDAGWVERIILQSAKSGLRIHGFERLASDMKSFAGLLAGIARAQKKGMKNVRVGKKGKGKANLSSGRNQHLVYLVYLIRAATGQPHYPELATLVAVLRGDSKPNDLIAAALCKAVARFEEKSSCWALAEAAEEEVDEWRRQRSFSEVPART